MTFVNANPIAALNNKRLIYYIIIDGKSEGSISYSFHNTPPDIWIRIQKKIAYFAVMYEGVYFCVYDNEPFADKNDVYAIFSDVLLREGLIGS